MGDTMITSVMRVHGGRFVGDGVHAPDLEAILASLSSWDDWFDAWARMGDRYARAAEAAAAHGDRVTAGEWFWQASLSYHYAQFLWFHDLAKREAGQRRKEDLYRKAAPLMVPPAERIEIPCEGFRIPAYLRFPPGEPPFPCVVLLGGLESTKEESYHFENMCLRRGLATFAFDGPGQGEMFFQVKLRPDFERFTGAVVDYLRQRAEINAARLGILGRSLGGYYAVRSAALVPAFRACVAWGALFDFAHWEIMHSLTRRGFAYVSGCKDDESARKHLQSAINLTEVADRLRCPLYVLHGAHDDLIPLEGVEKLRKTTFQVEQTFVIEPTGNHCCHNLYPVVRPRMADWLTARLGVGRVV